MAFGSSGGDDIKIIVKLVADEATKQAKELGKSIDDVKKSSQEARGGFDGLIGGLSKFAGVGVAATGVLAGFAASAVGISRTLLEVASGVEGLQNQFAKLNLEAGNDPNEQILKLRKSVQGLLTDAEIFEQFNKAAALGLPVDRFEELSAAAIKVGKSIDVDAQTAIESFTVGVGRQSIQMLDNLGIIIKSEEAYQKYATANDLVASKLTDTEKKAAFTAAAIDALTQKSQEAADIQETAAVAYEQFQVAIANAVKDVAIAVSNNEDLAKAIQEITREIGELDLEAFADLIGNTAAKTLELAAAFVRGSKAIAGFVKETLGFSNFAENFSVGFTALTKGQLAAQVEVVKNQMEKTKLETQKVNDELFDMANFVANVETESKKVEQSTKNTGDNLGGNNDELEKAREHQERLLELSQKALGISTDIEEKAFLIREQYDLQALSAEQLVDAVKNVTSEEDDQLAIVQELGRQMDENAKLAKKQADEAERAGKGFQDYANGISDFIKDLGSISNASDLGGILGDALTGSGGAGSFLGSIGVGDAKGEGGLGGALGISAGAASFYAVFVQAFLNGINNLSKKKKEIDLNPQLFEDYANELQIAFEEGAGETFGGGVNERKFNEIWRRIFKDFDPLGQALGINDTLGDIFGGPISGLQSVFGAFGSNDAGERARKAIVDALNELNDGLRLVIDGEFQDFDFKRPGEDAFGTPTTVTSADGEVFNTTEGFSKLFELGEEARGIFLDIGATLGTSMFDGLEEFAGSGIIGQIGALLAESTGGSLNNLQLAFESIGLTAEELGAALDEAFFTGEISAQEYLSSLNSVNELMKQGIPGAVGAVKEAFDNLREGGLESGQIAQDALQDLGAELIELAESQGYNVTNLGELQTALINAGADMEEVTTLMQALENQGVTTIDELLNIELFDTAGVIQNLENLGFGFEEPIKQIDNMNEKLDELENRRISAYVDVDFRAVGDPTAINAVEQGTSVDFGGEGRA